VARRTPAGRYVLVPAPTGVLILDAASGRRAGTVGGPARWAGRHGGRRRRHGLDARDVVVIDARHIVVAGDQGIFLWRHTP
jgi:hypothetical protein